MPMTSMKMGTQEAAKYSGAMPANPGDAPMYPYGLTVCLGNESMEKLGLDKTPPVVGTKMMLVALVEVTSISQRKEQDGDANTSTDLQITEMELTPVRESADLGKLYPSMASA